MTLVHCSVSVQHSDGKSTDWFPPYSRWSYFV